MIIPRQLCNKSYRFIKIVGGTKKPSEDSWTMENNYKYNDKEFKEYLKKAKSYGVLCGYGKLCVIDSDDKKLSSDIFMKLPNTLTIETGTKDHYHFYFIIEGLRDKIVMTDGNNVHHGECQYLGAQVLGAGSLHPNKKYYKILQDNEIATITKAQLDEVIKPYTKTKKTFICNSGINFSIDKIAETIPGLDLNSAGELQGKHPIHGSSKGERGDNFCINLEKNVWKCWRHETGGDAIALVGVLEGIVDCSDCTKGFWKSHPKEFKATLKVAEQKYGYVSNTYTPKHKEGDTIILFIDKKLNTQGIVKHLMSKYKFVTIKDSTSRKPHIYIYQNGYYQLNGRDILEGAIKDVFRDSLWSIHHKNEIMEYIKSENTVDRDEIQPPKHLINVNNGIYNLKTNRLEPHNSRYYFLYKTPINYNPNAKMPAIERYFKSTLKKEYVTLSQEIFGYSLYFDYFVHGMIYLVGSGGNGKSIFIKLLISMLGAKNTSSKEISSLMNNRFASSSLYGRLINICGEMSTGVMKNTDMLKRLTAGDMVDAEFKGRDAFSFPNKAKIITACNEIPQCDDDSDGWVERQIIIPFLEKFRRTSKDNKHLAEQLTNNESEMEGLLLWSIKGLQRLLKNEELSYPWNMRERYMMYQQNSKYFLEKCYTKGDFNNFIEVREIRDNYYSWCEENDVPKDSDTTLARKMTDMSYSLDRIQNENRDWIWVRRFIKEL